MVEKSRRNNRTGSRAISSTAFAVIRFKRLRYSHFRDILGAMLVTLLIDDTIEEARDVSKAR